MPDLKGLTVGDSDSSGRTYEYDGKALDMDSDTKGDQGIISAINTYKPTRGEYNFNEDDNVLTPAGNRAGTGDTGMYPASRPSRTASSAANSFDDIGREASEETEVAQNTPGAGVTDDAGYDKAEKDAEKERKEEQKEAEKAQAEREKAAARSSA